MAVTNNATGISNTGATLSGTLASLGGATSAQVYFQYGTSTSYTAQTTANAGSIGTVTGPLTGLQPGTTYHYRFVVVAGATTVTGDDIMFVTTSSGTGPNMPAQRFYGIAYGSTSPTTWPT